MRDCETNRRDCAGLDMTDAKLAFFSPHKPSARSSRHDARWSRWVRIEGDDRPRRPNAVDGRADDPAGVAGPFTARVKPGDGRALPAPRVADDADGRAAAGLGPGEGGVAEESPAEPPVHERETASARPRRPVRGAGGPGRPARCPGDSWSGSCPGWAGPRGNRGPTGSAPCTTARPRDRRGARSAAGSERRPADECCRFRGVRSVTTRPLLANGESWRLSLMPLVQK